MSSRLVTKIKDIKGIPGKYKRVLEAWAAFANNDGTSIRPMKESVADKAGISRWTVYKNTDDLLDVGVLVDTGKVHHYPGGHYVPVYRIDIAMLQNATQLVEKLRSKIQHGQCSKTPKSHVAKGDATQFLNITPVSLSEKDSSSPHGAESVIQPVGQLTTPTASNVEQRDEKQSGVLSKAEQTLCETMGESVSLPMLLGLPYVYADHAPEMERIAAVLNHRDRSVNWLESLVKWVKESKTREAKFWASRLHTGTRAMGQLAKHLESGEICEQFDSHIFVAQGQDALSHGSAYLLRKFEPHHDETLEECVARRAATKAAAAGFDLEEA